MPRLKSLPQRTTSLTPRLAFKPTDAHGHSKQAEPWRKWYGSREWKRLRWSVLVRDLFTCCRCKALIGDTSQLVADHKTAHHGDPDLFWNPENLAATCKPCHDSAKQAEDRRGW